MKEKNFKKMGPPTKDPSNVNPEYLKYKSWHINYYKNNSKKIKQKERDKRLLINQHRPSINLVCKNCNKEFTLPGMNKEGHKQNLVGCCSTVCQYRSEKLKKLWIPKWLYNYYFDKKLWRLVVGFKVSKHSIFSPKRQLYGIKNLNFHNFFILWHPNSFLRKRYKWIDKLIKKLQEKKRLKWIKKYTKTPRFKSTQRSWMKRQPKDSNFKIAAKFRSTVAGALKKRKGVFKHTRTQILLGTDFKTARAHIENLFESGMTWENHGMGHGKWNLDHKQPCASFDLKCPVQQLACFNYKNLQPLWAIDNMKKGAKLNYEFKPSRR